MGEGLICQEQSRKRLDGDKYLGLLCLGPVCQTDPHPVKLTAAGKLQGSRKFGVARHTSAGPFIDRPFKFSEGGPNQGRPTVSPRKEAFLGLQQSIGAEATQARPWLPA